MPVLPPPSSPDEARRGDLHYLGVDAKRGEAARRLRANRDFAIADRDAVGTLSISYGYHPLYGSFPAAAGYYVLRMRSGSFIAPDAYIWLQTRIDRIQERLAGKGARTHQTGQGWTTPEALERQLRFLHGYFGCLRGVPVYPIDANGDPEEVLERVLLVLAAIKRAVSDFHDPSCYRDSSAEYVQRLLAEEFGQTLRAAGE